MSHEEDARAAELHNLRLALATFALQLDAFEMRGERRIASGRPRDVDAKGFAAPRAGQGDSDGGT